MTDLLEKLNELDAWHRNNCREYKNIVDHTFGQGPYARIEDLPFIHVSAFKEFELRSVPKESLHRTLTSSGTSGMPSKILIDRADSLDQISSLGKIFASRFGQRRRQMYFVDKTSEGKPFDARHAATSGFMMLGRPKQLREDLDQSSIEKEPIIFGMTTDVWAHRSTLKNFSSVRPIVIHGGGWKKLETASVTRELFISTLRDLCPNVQVVNYFGMIEQVGTVYFDCVEGCFHEHESASFTIRSPDTLKQSERGLLHVVSPIPRSYPGHSLLTDDVCELVTACKCNAPTRAFRFLHRRKSSPARGCANV